MILLGVNIDHVATLRQARYRGAAPDSHPRPEPDPVEAARICVEAGAHSITVHLREDRRHAQDHDVERLRAEVGAPLNLEMAVAEAMVGFALRVRPDEVCLVPENRQEVTTEGGLAVAGQEARIGPVVERLSAAGIRVSLFIDPDPAQIRAAQAVGAPCIELHTGSYANASGDDAETCLRHLREGAGLADSLGLQVNAGHGLRPSNLPALVNTVPHLHTLNIGHSLMARAVFVGLPAAVREFIAASQPASGTP